MPRWDADASKIAPTALSRLMSVDNDTHELKHIEAGDIQAFVQGKMFGTIAYNAAAPTPGESGQYTFSTSGLCSWLTVYSPDKNVVAGDTVQVIYDTIAETYSYELVHAALVAGNVVNTPAGGIASTTVQGALNELDTEKANKTTQVIAGNGLTGGGTLEASRTINVAATDDSIVVADEGIKVDTVNALNSTSTTKPLSAAQGKALQDGKVNNTGNETITGVKTFLSSPIVPTPTTDMQVASKEYADDILAAYNLDVYNVCGAVNHYKRVLADAGGVSDRTWLLKAYEEYIKQRPETLMLYIPELGAKESVSGLNKFGSKLYDLSSNALDAAQATQATKPYMAINAAPNARKGVRFVQGQTQTGLLDFTDVVAAAGDSWTLTARVKINKKGASNTAIKLSTNAYIFISSTGITLLSSGSTVLSGSYSFECGRTYTIQFAYSNGAGLVSVGVGNIITLISSSAFSLPITFGQVSYDSAYSFDGTLYSLHLTNTCKATYQSQLDHQFLSLMFPEVEGVAIGNQWWATDNFAGTVAGDGTVINEVQGDTTDGNAELVTNPTFTDSTGWATAGEATISGGVARILSTAGGLSLINTSAAILTVGKWYQFTYDIIANVSGSIQIGNSGTPITPIPATVGNGKVLYFQAPETQLVIKRASVCDITIDNVYCKEVGASDSTNVYNYVYAATTGTATVKDIAATKAASGWCHYDNSAANGAVGGKKYNGYALHLFELYTPIRGYRTPFKLDTDQLVTANGGASLAGKRLKALFGGFSNANSTNESGFSAIPSGYRNESGAFAGITTTERFWTSTQNDATTQYAVSIVDTDALASSVTLDKRMMLSVRFLRNQPSTPETFEKTTGLITNNIAVTPYDITGLPFGNGVMFLRVVSDTVMTGFQAVLYTGAGAAKETLCTGVAITANEPNYIPISVKQSLQLQDFTVRVSATAKTDTAGRFMVNVGLESAYKNYL